jgi:hypothetical protein
LERQGVGRVRHLDIGVLWLQEQQLRRVVELTKVLGTSNPADLMTKHLAQESLNQYVEMLRYEFRQGRSSTTARLHTTRKSAQPEAHAISSVGEPPEAKQWRCIRGGHWQSISKGARAYRSPRAAGIPWSEVARRVTSDMQTQEVIDDIYPSRDGLQEAAMCMHIGGSRDIRTDIYTCDSEGVVGDARQHPPPEGRSRIHAAPPASRQSIINSYRERQLTAANHQLVRERSLQCSSPRAITVAFDPCVLAIEPVDSDEPGRLHVENLLGTIVRNRLSLLQHRRRVCHSDAFCSSGPVTACANNTYSLESFTSHWRSRILNCQACDFQSSLRGRPKSSPYSDRQRRQRLPQASDVEHRRLPLQTQRLVDSSCIHRAQTSQANTSCCIWLKSMQRNDCCHCVPLFSTSVV